MESENFQNASRNVAPSGKLSKVIVIEETQVEYCRKLGDGMMGKVISSGPSRLNFCPASWQQKEQKNPFLKSHFFERKTNGLESWRDKKQIGCFWNDDDIHDSLAGIDNNFYAVPSDRVERKL